jgi:eukaryotic-like serine/threonine-protein kinase
MPFSDQSHPLPPDRWSELDALFDAVLAQPPHERIPYLDARTRDDPALRTAVLDLLDASAHAGGFLDPERAHDYSGLFRGALAEWTESEGRRPGDRIGPYTLAEELGRGGVATVFLAERDDGEYRQRVALKVLRRGLDTDDLVARFRVERQILASLSHPNIARLLDGGATADGRPYLVMERIDGVPITEYCDRNRLPVQDRVRLCAVVARAVQHAHRNLIVHRDLKPSNILVANVPDGPATRAEVKLLDFGIAKLLDPASLPAAAPATRAELRLMTPEYASPEQVRGAAVTTATDVYQLGILLSELLSGRHPHPLRGVAPAEVERIVCHTEPVPPSVSVCREGDAELRELARQRNTVPGRLIRQLRGDLDTIASKAMQKEPERRYGSVEQMADDLERYLARKPITARPDSGLYRIRKFLRRHPVGAGAVVLAGVAVAGYLATVAAYAERLERERDRARLEAAHAEQVATFLTDIFQVSEPGTERGDTLRARTLLDRGAARIAAATAGDPVVRARMLDVIGGVYRQLGAFDGADATLGEALALREVIYGEAAVELAPTLRELALVRLARANYTAAESLARRALDLERRAGGASRGSTADAANVLARVLHQRGDYDGAQALYEEALGIVRPHGEELELRSAVMNNLGSLLRERGEHRAALPLLREALALREARSGPDHPATAVSLNALGTLLRELGELDQAATLYQRSLETRRRQLGAHHPELATAMNNLALLHRTRGDYAAAEALHREALELRLRLHGTDHPDHAASQYNLAETLRSAGRSNEAEDLYRRAIEVWRTTLGDAHPNIAHAMNGLAETLRLRGETNAAAAWLEQAVAIRRAALGDRHPLVASTLTVLALLHRDRHAFDEAEASIQEAIEIRRDHSGSAHPQYAHALTVLGSIRIDRGRAELAVPELHEALGILEEAADDVEPRLVADARLALARALVAVDRSEEARPLAKDVLSDVEHGAVGGSGRARLALELLASIHAAAGRSGEAAAYHERISVLP